MLTHIARTAVALLLSAFLAPAIALGDYWACPPGAFCPWQDTAQDPLPPGERESIEAARRGRNVEVLQECVKTQERKCTLLDYRRLLKQLSTDEVGLSLGSPNSLSGSFRKEVWHYKLPVVEHGRTKARAVTLEFDSAGRVSAFVVPD